MSNEAPGANRPPLSRFNASILLYLIATVVIGLLVGTVLNGLNKLPPYVATIAGSLGAVIALLSGLLGTLLERSFPKGIWRNANRPVAIVASILTVGFLTISTLVITSPSRCPSVGPCPQETATAPAQANDATATVQAYLTATAIAQAMQKYNRAAVAGIMYGFDAHHTRTNPYEIILSADNVAGLIQAWTAPTGDSITSSPAVANGMIYVGSQDHKLYAFDALSGTQKWAAPTGDSITSSPAVANGMVYVGSTDGKLYAFDALSGTQKWAAPTGSAIYSSPAVANGMVYVGSDDNKLYAFDAASGVLKWAAPVQPLLVVDNSDFPPFLLSSLTLDKPLRLSL